MKRMIEGYQKRYKTAIGKINNILVELEKQIGSQDFKMLKQVCMVDIPEQKNEQGEVVQAARQELNKQALITEARNLIVLQREERIKKGLRKRTTGRSSDRSAHRSKVKFLSARAEQAQQEEVK